MYQEMHKILEEGEIGEFRLVKYEIKENDPANRRCRIPVGEYIKLEHGHGIRETVIMSNTPMEERTNREFIKMATGDVFIAGLGIGMIVLPIQDREGIKSITIMEKNAEVIELIANQLPLNNKVKIIQGDVFTYEFEKDTKFDTIYFDIWDYINEDVYKQMQSLKRKYRKYARKEPKAFVKCWAEKQAKNNSDL